MNSYKLELQFETSFLTNQEFTCSIGLGDYPQLKGGWQKGGILFFHKQDWLIFLQFWGETACNICFCTDKFA